LLCIVILLLMKSSRCCCLPLSLVQSLPCVHNLNCFVIVV